MEPRTWILDSKHLKDTCAYLPLPNQAQKHFLRDYNKLKSTSIIPEVLTLWWETISAYSQIHMVSILDLFWPIFMGEKRKSVFPIL